MRFVLRSDALSDAGGAGAGRVPIATWAGAGSPQLGPLHARTLALHSVPKIPAASQEISLASP